MAKKLTLEQVSAALARWQTRMRRAVRAIEKLERQRKRLEKAATNPKPMKIAAPVAPVQAPAPVPPPAPVQVVVPEIDTSIPGFLQRKKLDPVAQEIADRQADTKRRKASGRIAKMKAKKSGELSKMPLTGKAALAAIRAG